MLLREAFVDNFFLGRTGRINFILQEGKSERKINLFNEYVVMLMLIM
jgi:hypothetical protein